MDLSHEEPLLPSKEEILRAQEIGRKLAAIIQPKEGMHFKVQDKEGNETDIELPASITQILLDLLEQVSNGKAIAFMPLNAELSTSQAADLLKVSRPFFIKMLEKGEIPFRKVGSHRRVMLADVLTYKREIYQKRIEVLDELTEEAQKLNWGYD